MGLNPGWRLRGAGRVEATMILFRDDAVLKHAYMQSGAPLKKARRSGRLRDRMHRQVDDDEHGSNSNWTQSLPVLLWSL